jgi:SAM-dependent methyltransferase
MSLESNVENFGPALAQYSALWEKYRGAGYNRTLDPDDKENTLDTEWALHHYYTNGADALRIIVKSLIAAELPPPQRILDFPCGSGRVMRHLRAMFADAEIGACDLYAHHVDFCAEQFGATPLMSRENLSELDVGEWDVIFCGSLVTHLPRRLFWPTMDFMIRSLKPGGIAVITLEGRRALYIQDNMWKLIGDAQFEVARKDYHDSGFGFVDYDPEFLNAKFNEQESYGVALVRPDWLMGGLAEREVITILNFTEADWDEHQDVITIQRRPVGFK